MKIRKSRTKKALQHWVQVNSTLLDQISTFPLKKSADVGCVKVPEIPFSVTKSLRKVPENPAAS